MTIEVPLTRGLVALVDDIDATVLRHNWQAASAGDGRFYARRWEKGGKKVYLHRQLMSAAAGTEVDHVNGDTLDNRRSNLRGCTSTENKANTRRRADNASGYKGVHWMAANRKWRAFIQCQGRRIHLGLHDTPERAARAYDEAARQLFGAFAKPNFPEED